LKNIYFKGEFVEIDSSIRFGLVNWDEVPAERHEGETGFALWKIKKIGEIRIRKVEYSPDYFADHWCDKGHIIYCIEGEMTTELKDGSKHILKEGMVYHVGDNADSHRSYTKNGVELLIID
jgi:hypothetical protein